ncbi:MAG: DUF4197 domain-containing protein [Porticoccaceae bacterium]|jgi:hypothetical protein|nr:DUF4197 domain-containing protein [Porticoccaceae bacterium]
MHRTPHRLAVLLAAALLLTACANTVDNLKVAAGDTLRNTLAFHFSRQFGKSIGVVIQGLAAEGGFLDNPLVRVLLPPPVGLVIDVARDFKQNPRAALLETVMNRAAEQAIPGAGPILQAVLADMDKADMQGLFDAGKTATTDHLKEKAGSAVREALLPVISEKLAAGGAVEIYGELLKAHQATTLIAGTPDDAPPPVAPEDLDDYVTDRAVDGLFRALGDREALIREGIANLERGSL